jgi:hypothetical protein
MSVTAGIQKAEVEFHLPQAKKYETLFKNQTFLFFFLFKFILFYNFYIYLYAYTLFGPFPATPTLASMQNLLRSFVLQFC